MSHREGRSKTPQKVKKVIGSYSYDLADKIGSGFSSNVYRGVNNITGQTVAIKVIDLHQINTPISKTLLKNEIQVLRQINNPNLLRVHDIYLTQNNTYIITEYCDQGDLADLIHKHKKLDQKQILCGMKALQQQQIIHRDIKPANILMSNGVPKLADFGFAISQNHQLDQSILKNFNVGTPLYMAPETILYNQYSEKSDVWALGVVLYEMLHGFPPYKAPSDSSLLNLYLTTPVNFSSSNSLPKDVKNLISNMLMIESKNRFSIDEVMEFLDPQPPKPVPRRVTPSKATPSDSQRRTTPSDPNQRRPTPTDPQRRPTPSDRRLQLQDPNYRSTDYLPRSTRASSPYVPSQRSTDRYNPDIEQKKTYFRSITPQNREFKKVADVVKVPQPLARRQTPTPQRSISPLTRVPASQPLLQQENYEYRRHTFTEHTKMQYQSTQPDSQKSTEAIKKPLEYSSQKQDPYHDLINKFKKPVTEITLGPMNTVVNDQRQSIPKNQMPQNDYDKKQRLIENISNFQDRVVGKENGTEDQKLKYPKEEKSLVLLIRFLQNLADKLDNYLTRQSSSSPPSYTDRRSILIMKCTFLFWKCMAIKATQMKVLCPELYPQVLDQFNNRFMQMQTSSYLVALMDGDRRFEVLFDQQVEDDCSGFYAILTHYISELVKLQIHQLSKDEKITSETQQLAKLMEKLVILHQVLNQQLKYMTDPETFNVVSQSSIEIGLQEDRSYIDEQSLREIIMKTKQTLKLS